MKKILFILFFIPLFAFAQQEPANNLGKTLTELKQKFPDLTPCGQYGGANSYTSSSANMLFSIKKNMVITEFAVLECEKGFERDMYYAIVNRFLEEKAHKSYLEGNDGKSISIFYSYFYIYLSYTPGSDVSISYKLYPKYYE